MADGDDQPMRILQVSQAAVAALALGALHRATADIAHEQSGMIGDAAYHLRWLRPILIFPSDAPDTVRLGLTIEGGVVLPSGRILSVDAFLTATAPPQLPQTADALLAQLSLADLAEGQLRLSYAGQELPPAPVRPAQGLPTDAELDELYAGLRVALRDLLGPLSAVPLTPILPPSPSVAARIAPEGDGATFALCFPEAAADVPLPILVAPPQNAAILLNSAALEAAFAEAVAPQLATLLPTPFHLVAMNATCAQDRLWFAAQVRQAEADGVAFSASIEAIPYLEGDAVRLTIEAIAIGSFVGQEEVAERFATALAAPTLVQRLETLIGEALRRATTATFGEFAAGALQWQWRANDAPLPFVTTTLTLSEGWLALGATLAIPAMSEELPELLAVELHVGTTPEPLDGGQIMRVSVVAAPLTPVTLPADYAWWNAIAPQTLLLEHTANLAVELRVAEDDPHDTLPRHMRARPLPIGLTTVHVALIDAFGRVALTEQEIDLRDLPIDAPATINLFAAPPVGNATANTLIIAADAPAPTLSEIPTRTATAYSPAVVRQEQVRNSVMGMLAGALAVLTLIIVVAAVILTRTLPVQGQPLTTPTSTATVVVVGTSQAHVPTATPAPGKTPTPVPALFGVFSPDPTALQFNCIGGQAAPQTLTLTNTGTAAVGWQVTVYGAITQGTSVQPWAAVAPTSGTLAPNQSVTLTVTVANAFCSVANADRFLLQFTKTSGAAVPVNVHATHT